MKNIIFLILTIILTTWCSHSYMLHPLPYNFGLCLVSAMLTGCWAMIIIDDVKQRLRDKE